MAERKWEVKTNRHPNCDGTSWGWIEGAPGNVCWSNSYGSTLTRKDAERMVHEHNEHVVLASDRQPVHDAGRGVVREQHSDEHEP